MPTQAEIRQAGELLGIPEDLLRDKRKKRPLGSKRAPVVVREYVPSEEHQIKAISALLRDAINTVPIDKRERTANAPGSAERKVQDELRAEPRIP